MLGGVAALKKEVTEKKTHEDQDGSVRTLFVNTVKPWPDQPRKYFDKDELKALGDSINEVGQKTPIEVSVDPENPGFYIIIDGERRWRACMAIGRKIIQAVIFPAEKAMDRYIRSVIANFGRAGHTPHETALALRKIYSTGEYTIKQVAAMFATSDCWVYQHLSLTKLDERVVAMMSPSFPFKDRLKFATAILLTALPPAVQIEIAEGIVKEKLGLKAARFYVEVKAAEKGFVVGGIASRPEKRRASLISLLAGVKESLPSFLNAPGADLYGFLLDFPNDNFAKVVAMSEECRKGIEALYIAVTAVAAERAKPKPLPPPKRRQKGKK